MKQLNNLCVRSRRWQMNPGRICKGFCTKDLSVIPRRFMSTQHLPSWTESVKYFLVRPRNHSKFTTALRSGQTFGRTNRDVNRSNCAYIHILRNPQQNVHFRYLQLSPRRNFAFPPLIAALVRVVGKPVAVIVGRYFRQRWADVPSETRKKLLVNHQHALAAIVALGFVYYRMHLTETPFTNRKKFSVFTQEQFAEIVNQQRDMLFETLKDKLLPAKHPLYADVNRVAMRLIKANQDIPIIRDQKWSVTLVNDKEKNAFVLPNGHIFVFLGMLEMVANDDQLGVVLGHEMAHTILGHGAEQFSVLHFVEYFAIIIMSILWAILPSDLISGVATFVMNKMTDLLLHLPYGRLLETEADAVGLQLSAKACFDVRESIAFWNRMNIVSEFEGDIAAQTPEFLSTHPTHEKRAQNLEEALPKALQLRKDCNCPPLPKRDPSIDVTRLKAALYKAKEVDDPWKPFIVVIK